MVELIVTMLISLALLSAVASLYLGGKASYRLTQDGLRLQQDGRFAMQLMESNLRQAGFGHLSSASMEAAEVDRTDFVSPDGKPGQGLRGCDVGFVKPMSAPFDFACKGGAGSAGFEVAYRVADTFDSDSGAGADCNGARAGSITLPESHPAYNAGRQVYIAANRFFVATPSGAKTPSLYCHGNGGNIVQPILDNVENMRLTFGVAGIDGYSVQQFLTAAQVDSLSPDQHQNWKRVIRVKLCLQLYSSQPVSAEPQPYVDCDGVAQLAKDNKLRAVMTSIITLRNNATASLTDTRSGGVP